MKVIRKFEIIVLKSLYAVQYEGEDFDEFARLFLDWSDMDYLEQFFELHREDLQSGFWGTISVEGAISKTIREAKALEKKLVQIAERGKFDRYNTLSTLFKPLHDRTTRIEEYEMNKAKGLNKPSWLRIYAIRLAPNLFVVSGGAIKLTETMNEREHLIQELRKLELTKAYLLDEEQADLEIFELF